VPERINATKIAIARRETPDPSARNISLDQSVKGKVTALRNNEFGSTDQRNPLGLQGATG
jgi:hypothetical protein